MGVWIETVYANEETRNSSASHPSWVCGLKLWYWHRFLPSWKSHPSWVCGLKLFQFDEMTKGLFVRPFVGVWIETFEGKTVGQQNMSHTLRGCVDWNTHAFYWVIIALMSHPSWVCGLKLVSSARVKNSLCHTLRGCVDWNKEYGDYFNSECRHTLRGCVDWNLPSKSAQRRWGMSHPSWVCGLKPADVI